MFKHVFRVAFFLFVSAAGGAFAFFIGPQPPPPSTVVEYYNTRLDHYFYTLNTEEIAAIDAGVAGSGWVRTGLVWSAWSSLAASGTYSFPACDRGINPCVPVSRFYGPGPNSHFFTGHAAEAQGLRQPGSGWISEGAAFFLSLPDSNGSCGSLHAVQRFNNGRGNHRYVANSGERARMRTAPGWLEEGIAFCALSAGTVPVQRYVVEVADPTGIMDAEACDAPTNIPRSCLAFRNLPLPRTVYAPASADAFSGKTMIWRMGNANLTQNVALPAESRAAAARDVFVQLSSWKNVFGLNLSTRSRLGGIYSSIAPMVRLPDGVANLRPKYGTSYELRLNFFVSVAALAPEPNGAAYGAAVIEYQDALSGLRFRSTALAYGSLQGADFVARDQKDGVVLVGSSFRQGSPYGRAIAGRVEATPWGGYQWWVNRQELAAAVNSARTLEPGLSANPDDYFIRSFGLHNEVYRGGEISMYLSGTQLEIAPEHLF